MDIYKSFVSLVKYGKKKKQQNLVPLNVTVVFEPERSWLNGKQCRSVVTSLSGDLIMVTFLFS